MSRDTYMMEHTHIHTCMRAYEDTAPPTRIIRTRTQFARVFGKETKLWCPVKSLQLADWVTSHYHLLQAQVFYGDVSN